MQWRRGFCHGRGSSMIPELVVNRQSGARRQRRRLAKFGAPSIPVVVIDHRDLAHARPKCWRQLAAWAWRPSAPTPTTRPSRLSAPRQRLGRLGGWQVDGLLGAPSVLGCWSGDTGAQQPTCRQPLRRPETPSLWPASARPVRSPRQTDDSWPAPGPLDRPLAGASNRTTASKQRKSASRSALIDPQPSLAASYKQTFTRSLWPHRAHFPAPAGPPSTPP
jgi:hypothetical protein